METGIRRQGKRNTKCMGIDEDNINRTTATANIQTEVQNREEGQIICVRKLLLEK